jgi:hypothetical protein
VLPSIRKTGGYSNKNRRIDRMVKRLGTDDAATLIERFEDIDQNRFINRYLADSGAKPIDFARFYNTIYLALTGKMAAELRKELGQKYWQTPLDRMSDEVLGLQKMVKRMSMRFIRERSESVGRPLVTEEWEAIVNETASVVVDSFVSRLGFEYGFAIAEDPSRGPIIDLTRRQIEGHN